nr:Stk1 family PASTA domain-containing Ser/Thr kinase [Rhabdothermincola salaria]
MLGPIGTGASATVYLADDVVLRRRVAVKVLHAALADDAAFLKRFQAEAQAAAALNHPHVMGVHDWGQGDVPYLVTELLGGGSLRAMLDLGHHLDPSQVRDVGIEAARGLDYAHRRGFVHRDIKPANLLFDDEGRLRIADFGLARALAEAAWTEPMGAVLGTARYASPEQAQGRPLDGRSDVYSLALVLVEALTGEVPFTADTTLGTLMARVGHPLPIPEQAGPLTAALAAAGNDDPAERPDAGSFATLLMAAGDLGPASPLPLAGTATIDPDAFEPREPTTLFVSERQLRAELDPEIMAAPPGTTTNGLTIVHEGIEVVQPETVRVDRDPPADDEPRSRAERRRRRKEEQRAQKADAEALALAGAGVDDGPPPIGDGAGEPPRRRRRARYVVAALVVLALLGGGSAAAWYSTRPATFVLPSYVGGPVDAALAELAEHDLVVEQRQEFDDVEAEGTVIGQDPGAGVELEEGEAVALVVSRGPPPVAVPPADQIGGKSLQQVTDELAAIGLTVGEVTRTYDENWDYDTVLGLAEGTPAELPRGGAVALTVSDGPFPRTVPAGLVGGTYDAAVAALEAEALVPEKVEQFDDEAAVGTVLSLDPQGGATVERGSSVTVVVSKGPELVTIPSSIVGMTILEASTALQNLGLYVGGIQGSPLSPVTGSDPAVGQAVRKETSVSLTTR